MHRHVLETSVPLQVRQLLFFHSAQFEGSIDYVRGASTAAIAQGVEQFSGERAAAAARLTIISLRLSAFQEIPMGQLGQVLTSSLD